MNDLLEGRVIADKYRIDGLMSESRTGRLYRGTHLHIGSPVTVRILSRGEGFDELKAARFSAEARIVSKIAHPNILNITDFGQDQDGTIYSVMESASGDTLRERVDKKGSFALGTAVRTVRQIAAALSASHSKGVFHGSLSAEKVVLSPIANGAELVKLIDVGSFEPFESFDGSSMQTELIYAAPELCAGEVRRDARSDVYSLGILLYELLAGEPPFTADTADELIQKHIQVPPPPLVAFRNDLPEEIEPVLLNALAKDPDKRYQSVSDFADALSVAADSDDEDDTIVVPAADFGAAEKNNIWKTAFIVLTGISILAFGLIYWTSIKRTDPATTLKTDANGQPVQPLNPASGIIERRSLETTADTLTADPNSFPADVGGDGYDPWANPGAPRPGQSWPIEPGGDYVTIPGEGSIFMPNADGSGVILVPKPVPAKTPEQKETPAPTPAATPGNTNTKTGEKQPVKSPIPRKSPAETAKPAVPPGVGPAPNGSGEPN